VSPGICHTIAREKIIEPGDFIQATDSHTCMGGSLGALAYGVGTTEYAALAHAGFTFVMVPETVRFELIGQLAAGVTAKDVMLYIRANHAKQQVTLDRVMEFGGPGVDAQPRRAPRQHGDRVLGYVEADEADAGRPARRPGVTVEGRGQGACRRGGADYFAAHTICHQAAGPMVATPGDAARGIPSDPTNAYVMSWRRPGDRTADRARR
jgi:3-isopropylmalate/(R)-2-methylmalate dehydratase large subunit